MAETAEARALLSAQPLRHLTDNTLTDIDFTDRPPGRNSCRRIQCLGGRGGPDAMGVAAPIVDDDTGTVTAGLSIVAMRRRVPTERLEAIAAALRLAAVELGRQAAVAAS